MLAPSKKSRGSAYDTGHPLYNFCFAIVTIALRLDTLALHTATEDIFTMRKWIRTYLPALLVMLTMSGLPVCSSAQAPRYDLLLKGGHVIDPANNLDGIMDVAVSKSKIAAVERDIPAGQAGKVVNVSGLYVTPGLIDIHFHIGHGGAPLNWFTPEA
ncbi:MAG TPA: hypothetical protein VK639_20960, partial [Terriglobales bacterium]|nr:hypothetical protein [Terriglobales bacterium]